MLHNSIEKHVVTGKVLGMYDGKKIMVHGPTMAMGYSKKTPLNWEEMFEIQNDKRTGL